MTKVAMFVEGQTEQIFLSKILQELIGNHGLTIDNYKFIGGSRMPRKPSQCP
jgi:predicted ATP-dependent endonuclease of OLD family